MYATDATRIRNSITKYSIGNTSSKASVSEDEILNKKCFTLRKRVNFMEGNRLPFKQSLFEF